MFKIIVGLLSLMSVTLSAASDYTGISLGGDIEGSDRYSSLVELNYVGRYSPNMSIYLGWAWRKVPTNLNFNDKNKISLLGTHAGFQVHPDNKLIRPFIGLGLYSAQVRLCDLNEITQCENEGSLSIYPEAGFHFSFIDNLEFTFKVRDYRFDRDYLINDKVVAASISLYVR